jgi:hypothetical protein
MIGIGALLLLVSCKKGQAGQPKTGLPQPGEQEVITIPVVIHVIYADAQFNISDEKIHSQIAVLNQDFRKHNPDFIKTPAEFTQLVADAGIEFKLATTDPDGKPTTGITRTFSDVNGSDGKTPGNQDKPAASLALYHTSKGGKDAWPRDQYLNIWITEISDRLGRVALAGYARFPGEEPASDGVVIDPRCFGTIQPLEPGNQLGRTATHEIGHWLNLIHIFAQPSDEVTDTPPGAEGVNKMSMNFMNYANDADMYMFTAGQVKRMRAVFSQDSARHLLYRNSRNK